MKCIVKDCINQTHEGLFIGELCAPCHEFVTTGNRVYSQVYKNTQRQWVGLTDEEARVKFESWHKAEYVQPLERYGHTYKNMHVRNRWQGWLAANGIKEKKHD